MSCHYAAAGGPRRACGVRSVGEAWHVLVKNSLQSHHLTTHHTPHTTHHTPHTLVCFIALPDSGERMHQVVEGRLHRSATLSGSDCTVGCSQPKLDFSLRQEDKLKVLKRAAGNNSVLHHSVLDWRDSPASWHLSYELPSPVLRNSQSCCDGSTPSHRLKAAIGRLNTQPARPGPRPQPASHGSQGPEAGLEDLGQRSGAVPAARLSTPSC